MTAVSDTLLLERFRAGDEQSFEQLFERHYDLVYGVLFRLTGTRAEAEDLAQDVFLKLYRQPIRHASNVAGWLYRVAVNTGYNALRANQRRYWREQATALDQPKPDSPESLAARREEQQQVRAALAKLKPRSAKLLILRESGFSYDELAGMIGVSPTSVGTLLARARKQFEEAYRTMAVDSEREEDNG